MLYGVCTLCRVACQSKSETFRAFDCFCSHAFLLPTKLPPSSNAASEVARGNSSCLACCGCELLLLLLQQPCASAVHGHAMAHGAATASSIKAPDCCVCAPASCLCPQARSHHCCAPSQPTSPPRWLPGQRPCRLPDQALPAPPTLPVLERPLPHRA